MKTLALLCAVAATASLAACAPQPLTKADVDGKITCHTDQMDQVERTARKNHGQVNWINCPQATLRVVNG